MGCSLDKLYEMSSEEHNAVWERIKSEGRKHKATTTVDEIEQVVNTLIALNLKAVHGGNYTDADKESFRNAYKILNDL